MSEPTWRTRKQYNLRLQLGSRWFYAPYPIWIAAYHLGILIGYKKADD